MSMLWTCVQLLQRSMKRCSETWRLVLNVKTQLVMFQLVCLWNAVCKVRSLRFKSQILQVCQPVRSYFFLKFFQTSNLIKCIVVTICPMKAEETLQRYKKVLKFDAQTFTMQPCRSKHHIIDFWHNLCGGGVCVSKNKIHLQPLMFVVAGDGSCWTRSNGRSNHTHGGWTLGWQSHVV